MSRNVITVSVLKTDNAAFDAAANAWLASAQTLINDRFAASFPTQEPHILVFQPGSRYIRVVKTRADGGSDGVYCFLDTVNGNVLKAANFKAPSQNGARGNIYQPENGLGVTEFGAVYFQRGPKRKATPAVVSTVGVAASADAPVAEQATTPVEPAPVASFDLAVDADQTAPIDGQTNSFDIFEATEDGAPILTPTVEDFVSSHFEHITVQ